MPAVLAEMLAGWETGQVTGRREHALALRSASVAKASRDATKTGPKAVEALFPPDPEKDATTPAAPTRRSRGRLVAVPDPTPVTGDADEDEDLAADDTLTDDDTTADDALASLW
jgi:hypothetical protein